MNAIVLPIHDTNTIKILSHTTSSMIEIIYNTNNNDYVKNEISKFRGKIFEISTKHNLLIAMDIVIQIFKLDTYEFIIEIPNKKKVNNIIINDDYCICQFMDGSILVIPLNDLENHYSLEIFPIITSNNSICKCIPLVCWLYENIIVVVNNDREEIMFYNLDLSILFYLFIEKKISDNIKIGVLYGICCYNNKLYCITNDHHFKIINITNLYYPFTFTSFHNNYTLSTIKEVSSKLVLKFLLNNNEIVADFLSADFLITYIKENDYADIIYKEKLSNIIIDITNEYLIMCWKMNIYFYSLVMKKWDIIELDVMINSCVFYNNENKIIVLSETNDILIFLLINNTYKQIGNKQHLFNINLKWKCISLAYMDNCKNIGILYNDDKYLHILMYDIDACNVLRITDVEREEKYDVIDKLIMKDDRIFKIVLLNINFIFI